MSASRPLGRIPVPGGEGPLEPNRIGVDSQFGIDRAVRMLAWGC